jgi:cobalt-zinc-cadmium efflux system outer membrane protein
VYLIPFSLAALWFTTMSASAEVLTRKDVVAAVLDGHPEVRAGEQAWRAVKARSLQNRVLPDPEIEFEYEELPGVFDTGQFGERTVSVTQTIENPFKWFYRSRSSNSNSERSRFIDYEMTRLRMTSRAKVAFDRVLADQMILMSETENLALSQTLTNRARIRLDAGDVPKLELLRSQVEEARAQNRLKQADARLAVSRSELNMLVGRKPGLPLELRGSLSFEAIVLNQGAIKKRATRSRPDLRGAELGLATERAARSAALAGWIPDLHLGVGRQTISSGGARDSFWRASFGFSLPVWAPFRQRGESIEASANRARAEFELASIERSAELEIEQALQAYRSNQEQVQLFKDRILNLAEETFRVARESHSQGKATYLDLFEAKKTLVASKVEHIETLFAFRTALAELELAVGFDMTGEEVTE